MAPKAKCSSTSGQWRRNSAPTATMAGLMVIGGRSLPERQRGSARAEGGEDAANVSRGQSPRRTVADYRQWSVDGRRSSSPVGAKPRAETLVIDLDLDILVVSGITGETLAQFRGACAWSGEDLKSKLIAEAPLAAGQIYTLVQGERVVEGSCRLGELCALVASNTLELSAFVTTGVSAGGLVADAISKVRELEGHRNKQSHVRDWEFFDSIERPVEVILQVTCVLLGVEEVKGRGLYGDYASGALPLLDPERLADTLSKASFSHADIPRLLARLEPYLADPAFSDEALNRVALSTVCQSTKRVNKTCLALFRWCDAVIECLRDASKTR